MVLCVLVQWQRGEGFSVKVICCCCDEWKGLEGTGLLLSSTHHSSGHYDVDDSSYNWEATVAYFTHKKVTSYFFELFYLYWCKLSD